MAENISSKRKYQLKKRFDKLCCPTKDYLKLNKELEHLALMKSKLLKSLENFSVPLHNNLSESDIREYVKRRKISGCTRSEAGRRSIDTFLSLKKTCQKQEVSFWHFLEDRLLNSKDIPYLYQML